MLTKAFLSPAEIEERIAQEAASDKDHKLTRSEEHTSELQSQR